MCLLQRQSLEGGRGSNGKQIGTGGTLGWLELDKDTKMAWFTIGASRIERSAVLFEGQGKIT